MSHSKTPRRPNILFLMADQMQARAFEPGQPCRTPNLDRLKARGVRFQRAYTPNAVCSPARASLMTGLLPHNHGVLGVVREGAPALNEQHPHWAQSLQRSGYRTGYFGKWHVELSETPGRFGWEVDAGARGPRMDPILRAARNALHQATYSPVRHNETPGYKRSVHYGVTEVPSDARQMGLITREALTFVQESLKGQSPWCCFISFPEPHDPYIAGKQAYAQYEVDRLELPPNVHDSMTGRPGGYRKLGRVWQGMTDREHREARACYFASITELDAQFGRVLDLLDQSGQADNTIIVLTSDHGDLLGAHGLYLKGYTAAEEIYNIPLIVAGPGIARGVVTPARVGLHDLGPTLLELTGCPPLPATDSASFAPLLPNPAAHAERYTTGYSEYHGDRIHMDQRIAWKGRYKYVLNGFDFDELYDLEADPFEMTNLIDRESHRAVAREMLAMIWERGLASNDPLSDAHYPMWQIAPFGPQAAKTGK